MIVAKLSWLLMLITLIVVSVYTGSSIAASFGALLVIIPLFSFIFNLFIRKKIEGIINCEASVRKGDDGYVELIIRNHSIFPVFRVKCVIEAVNQLNREKQIIHVITWTPPKKNKNTSLRYRNDYCGRTRIAIQKIVLYDCFGLVGIGVKCKSVCHITVQPDTFETNVSLRLVESSTDDSEVYSQEKPGADLTETFQIREYVPGDSLRQIHWKLTSKFDRLIVRDPGFPITRSILVFWERTGETNNPERIDAQAETVISLCRGLIDADMQFMLGWNDTDRNICILHEIHDMDELVAIIPRLLRATGVRSGLSGAGLLVQTRPDALCAHMVYLAEEPQTEVEEMQRYGNVTMMLCGEILFEGAILFDETSYREQLTQIEI